LQKQKITPALKISCVFDSVVDHVRPDLSVFCSRRLLVAKLPSLLAMNSISPLNFRRIGKKRTEGAKIDPASTRKDIRTIPAVLKELSKTHLILVLDDLQWRTAAR